MKHTLAFHLIHLSRDLQKALDFKSPPISLSYSQAFAILVINGSKVSQREIAKKLNLEPASVVTLIDELENLGLVKRQHSENDRRMYQIVLTEKGSEKALLVKKRGMLVDVYLRTILTEREHTEINSILEKISANLGQGKEVKRNEVFGAKRSMAV